MVVGSNNPFTTGALLDNIRSKAVQLLQSATANTDLIVVAMTGSGTVSKSKVAGTNLNWWKSTNKTGPFALCYAVASHVDGSPVNAYQAAGARWGWANSYAFAAKEVAQKSKTLSNGGHTLKEGSVFATPAYVIAPADLGKVTQLLEVAYEEWLASASSGEPPEIADAIGIIGEIANPRRSYSRRLSAAENKAIEHRAVQVVRDELESQGFATEDVGATRPYDIHAVRGGDVIKVEVKGTTTDGTQIYLTANEVDLHLAEHPNNALAIVRRILLETVDDKPVATGGDLELTMGWELDPEQLKPVAYTYTTGL